MTLETRIQEAHILIGNGDFDTATDILLEIHKNYPSDPRVNEILQSLQTKSFRAKSDQLIEIEDIWSGINGTDFDHFRFNEEKISSKLFDLDWTEESGLLQLRCEVINRICKEIETVVDEEEWLEALTQPIKNHPHFEHAANLEKSLEIWWKALFTKEYDQIKDDIDRYLKVWEVEEAQQCLDSLSKFQKTSVPNSLQSKITYLKQDIVQVVTDKQCLHMQCNHLQTHLTDWKGLLHIKSKVFTRSSQYSIPEKWEKQFTRIQEDFEKRTQAFIIKCAQACCTLTDIKTFYADVKTVGFNKISGDWFTQVQQNYQEINEQNIRNADSIEKLDTLRQAILAENTALPSACEIWIQEIDKKVYRLMTQWREMKNGVKQITMPKNSQVVMMPLMFQNEIPLYQQLWQCLEDIQKQLQIANTDKTFKAIAHSLKSIIHDHPSHQFAQKLSTDTAVKGQRYRFDHALQDWDITAFLEQCQKTTDTTAIPDYLQLAKNEKSIRQLDRLAHSDPCAHAQESATWWTNWHQTLDTLSTTLPYVFAEQLAVIARARRQVWFTQLDQIYTTKKTVLAEKCHHIAQTVEKWQGQSAHFIKYYQNFNRLAWHQEAIEYMESTNWEHTKQAITQFEQAGADKKSLERLNVLLMVKQADADNIDRLVNILIEVWDLVKYYLPEYIGHLAYKTISYTWKNNDKRLLILKNGAHKLENPTKQLDLWLKCLALETPLTQSIPIEECHYINNTILTFSQLVFTHNGQGIVETLREPVERIVTKWKKDDSILYIWFYNARHNVEPLLQLTQNTQQIAIDIKTQLIQLIDISDIDLEKARIRLNLLQMKWKCLSLYTNLLDFPPAQPIIMPEIVNEVDDLLCQLTRMKQNLKYLEEADLRTLHNQSILETAHTKLKTTLKNFLCVPIWLKRIQTLEPLTRLYFIETQFKNKIYCFGNPEPHCLEESDLLNTMQHDLLRIITVFTQANRVEKGMWCEVSKEYWALVCDKTGGGVLLPVPEKPELQDLCELLRQLNQKEKNFRLALSNLYQEAQLTHLPAGARIEVTKKQYHAFLAAIPKDAPETRRCYYFFEREVCKEPMATLLALAKDKNILPEWTNQFLQQGIPEC